MILCRRRLIKLTTGPVNRILLADEPGRRFAVWRGDLLDPTATAPALHLQGAAVAIAALFKTDMHRVVERIRRSSPVVDVVARERQLGKLENRCQPMRSTHSPSRSQSLASC